MAIEFTEVTLRGVVQSALTVKEGFVILRNGLDQYDLDVLAEVDKLKDGGTFFDALDLYFMPTGYTAKHFYAKHIIELADFNEGYVDNAELATEVATIKGKVATAEASILDHESRISAIEAQ